MTVRERRLVFCTGVLLCMMALSMLVQAGLRSLGRLVTVDTSRFETYGRILASGLVWGLSVLIITRMCRRSGISLEKRTVETLARSRDPKETGQGGPVVIGVRRALLAGCGALFAATAIASPSMGRRMEPWELGYVTGGLAALASVTCWLSCFAAPTEATEEGITKGSWFRRKRKRVSWSEIVSCTIITRRNVLGVPAQSTCRLMGRDGKELLRVELAGVPEKDRERFLALVRAKQGQAVPPELVAAEAPAGLGTELQSAQAPAGRGTEPEGAELPAAIPAQPDAGPMAGEHAQEGTPPGKEQAR